MTMQDQRTTTPKYFVLHISIPPQWWDYDPPRTDDAKRLRDVILPRRQTVLLVVSGIEDAILYELERELGPYWEGLADELSQDVRRMVNVLSDTTLLQIIPEAHVMQAARLLRSLYHLAPYEALLIALSEWIGYPLLVSDGAPYRRVQAIAAERPDFECVPLSALVREAG